MTFLVIIHTKYNCIPSNQFATAFPPPLRKQDPTYELNANSGDLPISTVVFYVLFPLKPNAHWIICERTVFLFASFSIWLLNRGDVSFSYLRPGRQKQNSTAEITSN